MKFVYPEFLWALLLLIAPIAIHLFSFRRHRTLYFSSLQFVQQIEQQNKSVQKLKHILILFCRLFALAGLVIAFAQPYFPKSSRGAGVAILAVHIDNSFSMTMQGVEGELLSEAIETAKRVIDRAPSNGKIMLSTNAMDGVEARLCTKNEALERLDNVQPSPMVRSYDEVVNWQKKNLNTLLEHETIHNTQLVYLSDFQKSTHFFDQLEADSVYRYIPIRFQSQDQVNLSIDSVWFASPLHKIGTNNELFVKITNHGSVSLQNLSIHFESEDMQRDLFIDVAKNSSAVTSLTFSPKRKGIHSGKVSISDRQFFADDDYFFTYTVSETSSILVINGADAHPSVGQIYQLDSFYALQQVQQTAFTMGMLQGVNLVIMNGLNDISSGLHANLIEYSQNGGTIAFFPGKNIHFTSVNRFLSALHLPSLSKEIAQPARIRKLNYNDPFFRGVFDDEKDNLSLPGVTKFYLVASGQQSTAMEVVVLQNGKTLLYRNQHPSQSFLFTSVLSPDYGSFLTDILYTTTLLRMGELSLMHPPLSIVLGGTASYPVYQALDDDYPLVIRGEKSEFIPEKRTLGHSTSLDLSGSTAMSNLHAGCFDLVNNQQLVSKIAINYDRSESNIESWTKEEVEAHLRESGLVHINSINVEKGASAVPIQLERNFPYWKILVVIALSFLLVELLIHVLYRNLQR